MPFNIGPLELIIVLVIALLVLGPGKLPEVGSALGKSIREFRKAASDIEESVRVEATPPAAPTPPAAAPTAAPPAAPAPAPVAAPGVTAPVVTAPSAELATPAAPTADQAPAAPVSVAAPPEPNTLSQPVAPNEIAGQPRP